MTSFKQNRKTFSWPNKSNFQNFCKTFCFAGVTPVPLNVIEEHFYSKWACAMYSKAFQKQESIATRCECGMSQA